MEKQERTGFASKLGIILATAGSAVGLGNIWRFPFMAGENGGAAFILIYIGCILLLGIPGMVCEFIVGRHAGTNAVNAYGRLASGKGWMIIGVLGVVSGTIILGFYSVVAGWCLQYLYASVVGELSGDMNYVSNYFISFSGGVLKPILWGVFFIIITHLVVIRGVRGGIERASKMLMPALFILLIIIVVASCMLPSASKGIEFLFKPDFSKVDGTVFLSALGQAFFSLSLGTACLCTYASYFSKTTNLSKSAAQIAVIDTMIAILAGLMIFPAAFSVGVRPDSGPSLIFITLPNVFQQAFSGIPAVGYVISLLFYLLLALAALTSTISMHEIGTVFFHEKFKMSRKNAAWIVTFIAAVICVFSSLSMGSCAQLRLFDMSLMDFFDFITAQIMMPAGALLTCIYVGWVAPHMTVVAELTNKGTIKSWLVGFVLFAVRYICPVCIIAVFLDQFGII